MSTLPATGLPPGCVTNVEATSYNARMSAQPVEREDPLDPQRILEELPEGERDNFLARYREALDWAQDPVGWQYLHRTLRLWSMRAQAMKRPGFHEAEEAALNGTGGGMLLEDAIRLYRRSA